MIDSVITIVWRHVQQFETLRGHSKTRRHSLNNYVISYPTKSVRLATNGRLNVWLLTLCWQYRCIAPSDHPPQKQQQQQQQQQGLSYDK
jgi:hypothetical protein